MRAEGYIVEGVESAAEALAALTHFRPNLVITDLRMENMDGIGLLNEIQRHYPGLRVLLLTAHGTIPDAVEATQSGAFGFLTKPVNKQQLLDYVERAMKVSGLPQTEDEWNSKIITRNPAMTERLRQAQRVAATQSPVLITGESGTGKGLLARMIHRSSNRRNQPFLGINCGAMAEELLESELFGLEKGTLISAHRAHKGLFHAADGGILFLDKIGDLSLRLQVKLLRVMLDERVYSVGDTETVPIDVRVISTTHQDLNELVLEGNFHSSLLGRLNIVNIQLPPLRERREDVPLLVEHFLEQIATEAAQERKVYAPEALELLVANDWPGNVRQLYNVVYQNVVLSPTRVLSLEQVRSTLGEHAASTLPSFSAARDEFTRNYLAQLLQISNGNVSQAARLAKRNRTDFYKLLGKHRLSPEHFK